jgi:(p)ppGpp synthase/HD superfamily hydrolase
MYGEERFMVHLRRVDNTLRHFGIIHEDMRAAAYLHDILEDTDVTEEELRDHFLPHVIALVKAVTDEPGETRAERKAKTYLKIRRAGYFAIILKLADRIANVEAALNSGSRHLEMYREEHPEFRKAILGDYYVTDTEKRMWQYLDDLLNFEQKEVA